MSKKFLVPIDMGGLEIQNFLAHNLAAAPTGVAGKIYFNTADHKLYYHNGTTWVDLTAHADPYEFGKIKVGTTLVEADAVQDTLELVAGSNVTLTPDATNDKITISATDTTYSDATTSTHGLMSASDKSKLDGIASGAEVNVQSDWNESSSASDAFIKNKPSLGTAAAKDFTNAITEGGTSLPTAGAVYSHVSSAIAGVDAMRFKGTIGASADNPDVTSLPTSGVKIGDTYRVVTAGTYAGHVCEIGDLIIAIKTTPTWTVAQTNIDGAITALSSPNSTLSIGGSGANRTLDLASGIVTAGSKGDSSNQTPAFGNTFKALRVTVDTYGRVTALSEHTVKIPDTKASASDFGLMKVGDGLKVSSGLVSTQIRKNTASITAGQTSVVVTEDVYSYLAYDASTNEEVEIDFNTNTKTFSIASAYANNISIKYVHYVS